MAANGDSGDGPAHAGAEALKRLSSLCDGLKASLENAQKNKKDSTGALARLTLTEGSLSLMELREVNRTV